MLALSRVDVDYWWIRCEAHKEIASSDRTRRIIPTSPGNHTPSIRADERIIAAIQAYRSARNRHETNAHRRRTERAHDNLDKLPPDGDVRILATENAAAQENAGAGLPRLFQQLAARDPRTHL